MTKSDKSEQLDVDERFLLANERTLLSWIRTGLAIIAGGAALTHISTTDNAKNIGLAIIILGAAATAVGYVRFRSADRAIRAGRLPAPGIGPDLVVAAVILGALALVIAHFTNVL